MDKFQNEIKEWVYLDSQSKALNDKLKEIKNKKNEIASEILDFVESNNLSTSTIKISDGKLKFIQNKQPPSLTLAFLENCLMDIFKNENKVKEILGIPEEYTVITLVNVGSKADTISKSLSDKQIEWEKKRPKRKPLKEFVFKNKY